MNRTTARDRCLRRRDTSVHASCSLLDKGQYEIVVMGAVGVGKSSIISRFLYSNFSSQHNPTVEDLHKTEYKINGKPLKINILDTSGTNEFPAMRQLAISRGDAFILVYSVDDESTFEEARRLRAQILEQKKEEAVPIVVAANKTDIQDVKRAISKEIAESTVCIDWDNSYVECSAKEDQNIEKLFNELLIKSNIKCSPSNSPRRKTVPLLNAPLASEDKRKSCVIS